MTRLLFRNIKIAFLGHASASACVLIGWCMVYGVWCMVYGVCVWCIVPCVGNYFFSIYLLDDSNLVNKLCDDFIRMKISVEDPVRRRRVPRF